ncbi:hypothetical protein MMC07_004845 [Pseudocyphellaria aurata]|nr:hypothetical protein [Pseudocyphellaria aurata]
MPQMHSRSDAAATQQQQQQQQQLRWNDDQIRRPTPFARGGGTTSTRTVRQCGSIADDTVDLSHDYEHGMAVKSIVHEALKLRGAALAGVPFTRRRIGDGRDMQMPVLYPLGWTLNPRDGPKRDAMCSVTLPSLDQDGRLQLCEKDWGKSRPDGAPPNLAGRLTACMAAHLRAFLKPTNRTANRTTNRTTNRATNSTTNRIGAWADSNEDGALLSCDANFSHVHDKQHDGNMTAIPF